MASAGYPAGFAAFLKAGYDIDGGNLKIALVKSALSYNTAHDAYDDISANVIGTPIALATVTCVAVANVMTLDAADTGLTWAAVAAGDTIGAQVVYYDSGVAATSYLIAFLDCTDTPTNGSDITVTLNASGIMAITF